MQMLHPTRSGNTHHKISWRQLITIVALFILSSVSTTVYAQLLTWNPSGVNSFGPSPWAPTTPHANLSTSGIIRGAGVLMNTTAAGSAWGGTNWFGAADQDITFTVTANAGYQVSLSTFNLAYRRSGTGAATATLQFSVGGSAYTSVTSWSLSSSSSG